MASVGTTKRVLDLVAGAPNACWSPQVVSERTGIAGRDEPADDAWIRTSGAYDRIIDFEPVMADPADPLSLRSSLTCDHVHPNAAGYRAMANSIDLSIFQ